MKILNNLFTVSIMLIAVTSVQAQSSWTYVDAWWEVRSDNYQENTIEQESGFLLTMNGQLRLNAKVVTEVNPASHSHGFAHGVAITNVAENRTVAEKSDSFFYTGEQSSYTTSLSYDVPEEGMDGPFEVDLLIEPIYGCPKITL